MIEFASPACLLLALAVPPLVWWWLRRRRPAFRYSATGLLAGLPAARSRLARWAGAAARATALLLLVVAVAGPRRPDLRTRIPAEGIAVEMLVDVSGSMAEPDFRWQGKPVSRLAAAKNAFGLFVRGGQDPAGVRLEGRPNDLVGLVTFATWPENACPLTLSHSALLRILDEEQPRAVPTESRTNVGDAIAWGLARLESAGGRRKVMVLLTDGEHNVPPPALTPRQAAQLAANLRVPVYAIDAGGEATSDREAAGEPHSEADTQARAAVRAGAERSLQAVAEITGGRYFRARDTEALLAVCREIDRLERTPAESFQYRRYYQAAPWFGLGAFVLLAGVGLLEKTVWRRVP